MVIAVRRFRAGVPIFLLAAGHWYAEAATRITPTFLKSSKDLGDVARTCDVDAVQDANVQQLHPILHDLVNTTFFRLFRVNLKNPSCPYWKTKQDEKEDGGSGGTCGGAAAAPTAPFLKSALFSSAADEPSEPPCSVDSEEGSVDMLDRSMNLADQIASDKRNNESEFDCEFEEDLPTYWVDMCAGDSTTSGELEDVNLIKNPERNTGYNGRHIWEAMYQENCFEVGNSLPRGRYSEVDRGMCYEERVLYRLLSGWHASTTLSIVKNYYAPGTKRKKEWAPNLDRFMQDLGSQPDRVKNLHFSFVVMLRAVKKAGPMLLKYPYSTGSEKEDAVIKTLMSRLLDSQVLSLCSPLFDAFDETRLFVSSTSPQQRSQLKRQFKSVFRNITVLVDCVQCQRCRLHAKLYSLGLGTALKILLTPPERMATSTTRDEVVALVHVLWKLSEAMQDAGELAELYYKEHTAGSAATAQAATAQMGDKKAERAGGLLEESTTGQPTQANIAPSSSAYDRTGLLDSAFGAIRQAGNTGTLSAQEEEAALRFLVLQPAREEILLLAKHYAQVRPDVFTRTLLEAASAAGVSVEPSAVASARRSPLLVGTSGAPADAVVIGGGLAGMVACMSLLDRGATVVMIEKQPYLGGNSGKASSGINAALETTVESLVSDTTRSAGVLARPDLIGKLANDSASAVSWLRDRTGVDLSMRSQLGGHSVKRTLRPNNAFVGAEITASTSRILSKFASEHPEQFRILTKAKWLGLEQGGAGWRVKVQANATEMVLEAASTVIASGGFGHDRKEAESLLLRFRPDLEDFPTTLGPQTTGDGVKIARDIGARLVDMDRVQLHPTGFVNPEKPEDHTKTLAAELLRGVGGLLLDVDGRRFTNELGTRQAVVNAELEVAKAQRSLKPPAPLRATSLVLNGKAAAMADRHVALYSSKGLLRKVAGLGGLATHLGVPVQNLRETFEAYNKAAQLGQDEFGRTVFPAGHWPIEEKEDFFVGQVVPVIHYTMGGIAINPEGQVLRPDNTTIPSLYAIGEASGGVHGDNRLAGNSLLECTVFGRHVGLSVPIQSGKLSGQPAVKSADPIAPLPASLEPLQPRKISLDELKQHNTRVSGNWVALYGRVYELADYVDEHPGGAEAILDVSGVDGTTKFEAVHNRELLESMGFTPVGVLEG